MKEFEKQMSFFDGSKEFKIDKPIRLIELFAGIGAQASALERLQDEGLCTFEHYRICEFDKYAVKSYNAIHGTDFQTSDITELKGEDLGIVDTDDYCYIMTYSFPCTDLSLAGKQEGMAKGIGTRSGLLWEVERLLNEVDELPQVLLMENVPQVICDDFFEWCRFLESKGYKNYYKLMNAKDYGVPQNSYIRTDGTVGTITTDGSSPKHNNRVIEEARVVGGIGEMKSNNGTQWYLQDRVYDGDVSVSVCSAENPNYVDRQLRIRKLTPRECFRLMDFTDEQFERASKVNSDSQLYKQAGNSIVVNVLYHIFKQMLEECE